LTPHGRQLVTELNACEILVDLFQFTRRKNPHA
jgi:microsomal dipeptidase-like Zn-dependent dipeptidase